jgi:hypothetical protein
MTGEHFPMVELDSVARLRVMAGALDGVSLHEITLDVPYERLWPWLTDVERSIPTFDRTVRRVCLLAPGRDGRPRLRAWPSPVPLTLDVRAGWMWMSSPVYLVGMAAVPDGPDRTRLAHLEGVPLPGGPALRRLLRRPVAALGRALRRHVEADVAGIRRAIASGAVP